MEKKQMERPLAKDVAKFLALMVAGRIVLAVAGAAVIGMSANVVLSALGLEPLDPRVYMGAFGVLIGLKVMKEAV